jgi:hypothetical protein
VKLGGHSGVGGGCQNIFIFNYSHAAPPPPPQH